MASSHADLARRTYRVVGFLTGGFGLAIAARNTLRGLEASGRGVDRVILQNRWHPGESGGLPRSRPAADEITLFHVNPSDVSYYRSAWRPFVAPRAPAVCVPFWELPIVPVEWRPVLGAMNAVLAPTRFIADACSAAIPRERVIHYPQAALVPPAAPARDAWSFDPRTTVFLVTFDLGSDIERKNPWAAIEAFGRAFPSDRDVRLVIKMKPWLDVPTLREQSAELRARIARDPRIRIIDRALEFEDLMSLYASCDVVVALHRSEGLGLHLMEAMSLGKAVVATGWSGNMDFMDSGNSVPVNFRLVPVRSRHAAYAAEASRPGQVWADADVSDAADAMRALHASTDRRRGIGAAATRDMEERRRRFLAGTTFDALERMIPAGAERAAAFDRAVLGTRALLYWKSVHGMARALARSAGFSGT